MKRLFSLILALTLLVCAAALAEKETKEETQGGDEPVVEIVTPAPMATLEPVETPEPLRLTGVRIGIDPGHQAHGNSQKEAIAPGSSEMKAKVSSGTEGVKTHVAEYVVNLDVGLMLRDALEELGAEVYMTDRKSVV